MGLRFSLKNANAVGHLVEGNIITFLNQCTSGSDTAEQNIRFIDNIINNTEKYFFTSERYFNRIYRELYSLKNNWNEIRHLFYRLPEATIFRPEEHNTILSFLQRLSHLFNNCQTKSILIPGFEHNDLNYELINPELLNRLIKIHPGSSSLILQIEEIMGEKDAKLLNVFPNFDISLYNIDKWPGVFIWKGPQSIFIPINSVDTLISIYHTIKYEKTPLPQLREQFLNNEIEKPERYTYLFHLSDLHFGNRRSNKMRPRLIEILKEQQTKLNVSSKSIPIITGDIQDTPRRKNEQIFADFTEELIDIGFEDPIYVLGNHDYHEKGIFRFLLNQKDSIKALLTPSKIKLINKLSLGVILFDSNCGGDLAQGQIGNKQLAKITKEMNKIRREQNPTFIGILHHHPLTIDNPDWYRPNWYEKFLGLSNFERTMKLIDAEAFLSWISQNNINLVLHGHKHIPHIDKSNGSFIVGAGSSTGHVRTVDNNKTYLSFNLIKYDNILHKPLYCIIIAEDTYKGGAKNILAQKL